MKILQITSELPQLAQVGGLADMVDGLSRGLVRNGHDVACLLPAYPATLAAHGPAKDDLTTRFLLDGEPVTLIHKAPSPGGPVVLLASHPLLSSVPETDGQPTGGDGVYRLWPGDDDRASAIRFALFCRIAVLIAENQCGLDWKPDIIHSHDWPTALVNALLARRQSAIARVFTIHNLGYRGLIDRPTFDQLQLSADLWQPSELEFHGQCALIKAGLIHAQQVTAVSPTYTREMATPEQGQGLDGLIRHLGDKLTGVLNGIDIDRWNPTADPHLPFDYSPTQPFGKTLCKTTLKAWLELDSPDDRPLIGFIGRLVDQKGIDLLIGAAPTLLERGCDLVVLGSGQPDYEHQLRQLAHQYAADMVVHIGFDAALAHQILAAADVLLVPSRFEPCGLVQMYAMRYGTVPVARRTGGLADSISDPADASGGQQTGFLFEGDDPGALIHAVDRALVLYHQREAWDDLRNELMTVDWSWTRPVEAYERIYRRALHEAATNGTTTS